MKKKTTNLLYRLRSLRVSQLLLCSSKKHGQWRLWSFLLSEGKMLDCHNRGRFEVVHFSRYWGFQLHCHAKKMDAAFLWYQWIHCYVSRSAAPKDWLVNLSNSTTSAKARYPLSTFIKFVAFGFPNWPFSTCKWKHGWCFVMGGQHRLWFFLLSLGDLSCCQHWIQTRVLHWLH